jgi:hypothetical protein
MLNVNRAAKIYRRLAGLAVSISITALGEPVAICAVAIVLILATVVCWAITDEQRSTRLTALVSAWRNAPRRRHRAKPSELPTAAPGPPARYRANEATTAAANGVSPEPTGTTAPAGSARW